MTSFETYLRYSDLFGAATSLDEFQSALKSFDLGMVLKVFAAINVLCSRRGLPQNWSTQLGLIREMFDPQTAERIERRGVDVFHRRQCLFVLREAMSFSPDIPDMQLTLECRNKIGLMALMANDHASSTTPSGNSEAETSLARICDFVSVTEANELNFDFASVARMHKIVNDLAPARASESSCFDIACQFESATGLPLRTFEVLMLAILPRIMFSAGDLAKKSADYGVHFRYFEQTGLEPSHRDAFLDILGRTSDQFRARLAGTDPLLGDFTVIRDTPFLRSVDRLVPLDTTSYMEKLETAVFWSIHKKLPEERKQNFSSFWAKLFEDYITWLLQNSVDQNRNKFYPRPRYSGGNCEEVCDGILICGQTAIFIECKGGVIRGDAKYGGDQAKLRSEIEKKYVRPKGVYQVAKAIASALNRGARPSIEGVNLHGIHVVMPLVITRDDIGGGFFVNTYLNLRFSDAKSELGLFAKIYPVYCTQLFSISVDTIEKRSPYLCDTRLAEILSQRYIADPSLATPFFLKHNSALSLKGPVRAPTLWKDINDELRAITAAFLKVGNAPSD